MIISLAQLATPHTLPTTPPHQQISLNIRPSTHLLRHSDELCKGGGWRGEIVSEQEVMAVHQHGGVHKGGQGKQGL